MVWMTAQHKSPPRRPTLFPFPKDLFTAREGNGVGVGGDGVEEQARTDLEAGMGTKGKAEHTSMRSVGSVMEEGSLKDRSTEAQQKGRGKLGGQG